MSNHSHETHKETLAARYADLLSEQADADELQLLNDLETLYASARVPEHLTPAQTFPDNINARQTRKQSIAPELPPTISPKRHVVNTRRRRWLNQLNALAAVLIAAVLVGSLLVATHMVRHPQRGNGNTSAQQCIIPQTPTHKSTAWLSSLYMINLTTGWALGRDHLTNLSRVLHTTDGGITWQDVTPTQRGFTSTISSQKIAYISASFFLNGCSAWIAVIQPGNAPALLFHTANGGLTWQQFALPGNQIRGIDFIDAHMGWLVLDVLKNGIFNEENIYRTNNAGQTWQKIVNTAFPFANADNDITFINPNTGWITGALSINNSPRLYITHDGGQIWNQQLLPLPSGASFADGTVVWQPQFFSASDGILPVSFWSDNGLDVYVTHDGGKSWQSTSLLHIPMPPAIDVSAPTPGPTFVDVNHGWVAGWGEAPLYATSDGGKHWTKIIPRLNLQYQALGNYDFVTDKVGWAIGGFTGKSLGPVRPTLFRTEDGGKTWTFIRPG